jgi:hypothetical protein
MATKKATPLGAIERKVKETFKHGKTTFEKGKTYSFSQGALARYADKLEKK